jgi:hypothetical protein
MIRVWMRWIGKQLVVADDGLVPRVGENQGGEGDGNKEWAETHRRDKTRKEPDEWSQFSLLAPPVSLLN